MKKYIAVLILCLLSVFCLTAVACGDVEFSINFIVDDNIYATVSTGGGETIKMPENPKKDGYDFDGWFWDKDVWDKPFTANSLLDAPLSSDMSVYARFTKQHEHNYTAVVTAPTCTERGYTTYTCDCGDSYIDDYVDELGHEFTEYVSDDNATYDSDGTKTAYCNHGCGETHTIPDVGTKLKSGIAFQTLTVDSENNVFGKVPNTQETFSFVNEISVNGNAEFFVSPDIYGINNIPTKTVPLAIGNNVFYVTETVGNNIKLFTVTVRRKPTYEVTFNTDDGTIVETQIVEEDSFSTEPNAPTKTGYNFIGWDFNFTTPIEENTAIKAQWNYFTLTTSRNNTSSGTVTAFNQTKITIGESVTITATTNVGYTFVGWYNGEEELTSDLSYTFTMPSENITYTAKWKLKEELENFNFSSTTTTCTITGIKNKTVTEIIVPDYVTSINEGAFSGCSQLESISLPFVGGSRKTASDTYQYPFGYIFGTSSYTGGTATEQYYYYGRSTSSKTGTIYYIPTSLKSVTVTGGNILYGAFQGCSLTSITIPDSVTSIGERAFCDCSSLTSITIPDSVTNIENFAFCDCSSLTSVYYTGTIDSWCEISFSDWAANPLYYAKKLYINNELVTNANIPTATKINAYAFLGCSSLTNITIPDSVKIIGEGAFSGCIGLTSITLPNSVKIIGSYSFSSCSSLTSITIPNSVKIIGEGAFSGCIGLTSITIPDSVTSIWSYAFYNCSSLTSVYYLGTAEDWNNISMGSYNNNLTTATRYYYSETEPTTDGNYWHYENGEIVVWAKEN